MQDAMRQAGRGEVLSYQNVEAVVEMEESDYQARCARCGVKIDTRTAKHQREWTRFGGSKVQVDAHYCDGCFSLLRGIGAGERTELEERAGYVPSYEPTHKEDF
jgi:hypothetical protein